MDHINNCIAEMSQAGLIISSHDFAIDGKIHRIPDKEKPKAKDGWYISNTFRMKNGNNALVCAYGSWRTGYKSVFKSYQREKLSRDEISYIKQEERNIVSSSQLCIEREKKTNLVLSLEQFMSLPESGTSPYLQKKKISAHKGCRFSGETFLIPLVDLHGKFYGIQSIFPDGKKLFGMKNHSREHDKSFLTGTFLSGHFFLIGRIARSSTIYIAEGYATGATIHDLVNQPVVIAFNCNNLIKVASKVRERFRNNEIIIAGDDDWETEEKSTSEPKNPGRFHALKAAKTISAKVTFPPIKKGSDFNDNCIDATPDEISRIKSALTRPGLPGDITDISPHLNVNPNNLRLDVITKRYRVILETLSSFKVSVRPPNKQEDIATEGPAVICYRVIPNQGVNPKKIFEQEAAIKLSLKLPESAKIRFAIDRGAVTLEVPKEDSERCFVGSTSIWGDFQVVDGKLIVPIGVDIHSNAISINFSGNSPHLLIGGTTGSGKSEALNTILHGLCNFYSSDMLKLMLIDPKCTELIDFEDEPHLQGSIGNTADETIALLSSATKEMDRRYLKFKESRVRTLAEYNSKNKNSPLPWWVIVLDEYQDLTSDPSDKSQIEMYLKRIAQKARAAGIHLIIATQKPSAKIINTSLRSNLPTQLALSVSNATESRIIMDESGAEKLTGKGDAFLKVQGEIVRVQCAKV